MSSPDTPAGTETTPPVTVPAGPATDPTPMPPVTTGNSDNEIVAALNSLPEKLAATFREIQAPPPPIETPKETATEPTKTKTKSPDVEPVEPPRQRTFADKWFGR